MKNFVMILMILVVVACNSTPSEPTERPGGSAPEQTEPEVPEVDITPELKNDAQRIVLTDTVVRYDDGGVIFGKTTAGVHFVIDITTGWRADFDTKTPSLKVSGKEIGLQSCEVAKQTSTTTWYTATPATNKSQRIILVTKY